MKKGDPICCGSKCTAADGILWGIFIASAFALVLVGIIVVAPYSDQQSGDYTAAKCKVETVQGGAVQVCWGTPEGCPSNDNPNNQPNQQGSNKKDDDDSSSEEEEENPGNGGDTCPAFPCFTVRLLLWQGQGITDGDSGEGGVIGTPQYGVLYASISNSQNYPQVKSLFEFVQNFFLFHL